MFATDDDLLFYLLVLWHIACMARWWTILVLSGPEVTSILLLCCKYELFHRYVDLLCVPTNSARPYMAEIYSRHLQTHFLTKNIVERGTKSSIHQHCFRLSLGPCHVTSNNSNWSNNDPFLMTYIRVTWPQPYSFVAARLLFLPTQWSLELVNIYATSDHTMTITSNH